MSRIQFAANILRPLAPQSILDVGCRDCSLGDLFPNVEYAGADLCPGPRVKYVGDVAQLEADRSFDAVVALDILEHLESPSGTFDRLLPFARRWLLISLPNIYDLKSRMQFLWKGHLGGKYVFGAAHPRDRHRWLMNRAEVREFAHAKAAQHGLSLSLFDMTYGASENHSVSATIGRITAAVVPRSLSTATVFALFIKPQSR